MSPSFSEKCLVCLLGYNLKNTSESREHTLGHTPVGQTQFVPSTTTRAGCLASALSGRRPAAALLGHPNCLSPPLVFFSPGAALRASRRRKLLTTRRGHVMQGWVCVSDALVFKYIIFSHIVISYKLHPT